MWGGDSDDQRLARWGCLAVFVVGALIALTMLNRQLHQIASARSRMDTAGSSANEVRIANIGGERDDGAGPAGERDDAELAPLLQGPHGIELVLVRSESNGTFYLAKHPVTQAQWRAVLGANPCARFSPEQFELCGPEKPVVFVAAHEAERFVQTLSRQGGRWRLPTAEERAAAAAGATVPLAVPEGFGADFGEWLADGEAIRAGIRQRPLRGSNAIDVGVRVLRAP